MQLNIIGTILGTSGYDSHTRQLTNALSKICDVRLQTNIPHGAQIQLTDKELSMIKKPNKEDINLIVTHPLHWRLHTTAKRNWVYCVWEGDKVPEYFIEEMLNPDIEYIFVPSNHTKEAIVNTLKENPLKSIPFYGEDTIPKPFIDEKKNKKLIKKIKVIPHGVDLDKFYPSNPSTDNKFVFFCNKGFRNMEDRGGVQYLIKAFIEEFKPGEAELHLKINPAYGIPDITKMFDLKNTPIIKINANNIKYEDLIKLYNQCDVYVAPTRAEAFNLGCIEAMACGKPVITTTFGGQTDYCTEETGWLVDGDLKEVEHELEYEGIKWLTPDIEILKNRMRRAYDNGKERLQKGKKAKEVVKKYTWDSTAKQIAELI